nr:DUF2231 domain-containing protein [Petropleomorpha daqingensis]
MALGVAAAVPTAIAGWAEWAAAGRRTQRAGMTHASLNGLATLLYAASWAARARDRHRLGIALSSVADVPLLAAAFLGGHMGSGRDLG